MKILKVSLFILALSFLGISYSEARTGSGSATVIVGAPAPSGTITATNCTVPGNGVNTCNTSITWTTANLLPYASTAVTTDKPTANTVVSTATTGSGVPYAVYAGVTNFYLYHNGVLLAQAAVTVSGNYGFFMGASSFIYEYEHPGSPSAIHIACQNTAHIRAYGHMYNTPFLPIGDKLYEANTTPGVPVNGRKLVATIPPGPENSWIGQQIYENGWIGVVFDYASPSQGTVVKIDENGNVVDTRSIPNDSNGNQDCSTVN